VALPAACLAILTCLLLTGCVSDGSGAQDPAGNAPARRAAAPVAAVQVTVTPRAAQTPVPRSYLGLSTEYSALPAWAHEMPLLERALSLVRVRGDGPFLLRIGGDSADHSIWDPSAAPMPPWAFSVAPVWLRQARTLVARLGARIILDLNLITDTPAAAAQWARAARAALPRHGIAAFEVGNEPDIYSLADWRAFIEGRRFLRRGGLLPSLPETLTASHYLRDFRAYARALDQVAPDVPLAGPALANPVHDMRWVPKLIDGAPRSLGLVTIHRYPYTGCLGRRDTSSYATIGRILSPAASTGMAAGLRPLADDAHDAGLPLRLTELNSVNCGGRAGVSDSFATALWAPDALFALMRAGVNGVNIHVRADAVNAAFALGPEGLQARPLFYGLILFARALGPRARLLTVRARAPRAVNLAAWAVRVGRDTLHVVLIDKGRRSARVALRLPAEGAVHVQRLLAPSVRSPTGVTFGGRQIGTNGRWQGLPARQTLSRRGGTYVLVVRSMSAALLSARVPTGALGVPTTGGRPPREARRAPPGAPSPPR
jgi:Glycosyl hydrolase family 79 C-terminal beta domain